MTAILKKRDRLTWVEVLLYEGRSGSSYGKALDLRRGEAAMEIPGVRMFQAGVTAPAQVLQKASCCDK